MNRSVGHFCTPKPYPTQLQGFLLDFDFTVDDVDFFAELHGPGTK